MPPGDSMEKGQEYDDMIGCAASSVKIEEGRLDLFYFFFPFYFLFYLLFYFLLLEQLGLGLIGYAVTSVTI